MHHRDLDDNFDLPSLPISANSEDKIKKCDSNSNKIFRKLRKSISASSAKLKSETLSSNRNEMTLAHGSCHSTHLSNVVDHQPGQVVSSAHGSITALNSVQSAHQAVSSGISNKNKSIENIYKFFGRKNKLIKSKSIGDRSSIKQSLSVATIQEANMGHMNALNMSHRSSAHTLTNVEVTHQSRQNQEFTRVDSVNSIESLEGPEQISLTTSRRELENPHPASAVACKIRAKSMAHVDTRRDPLQEKYKNKEVPVAKKINKNRAKTLAVRTHSPHKAVSNSIVSGFSNGNLGSMVVNDHSRNHSKRNVQSQSCLGLQNVSHSSCHLGIGPSFVSSNMISNNLNSTGKAHSTRLSLKSSLTLQQKSSQSHQNVHVRSSKRSLSRSSKSIKERCEVRKAMNPLNVNCSDLAEKVFPEKIDDAYRQNFSSKIKEFGSAVRIDGEELARLNRAEFDKMTGGDPGPDPSMIPSSKADRDECPKELKKIGKTVSFGEMPDKNPIIHFSSMKAPGHNYLNPTKSTGALGQPLMLIHSKLYTHKSLIVTF